jgi:hypothetical protein
MRRAAAPGESHIYARSVREVEAGFVTTVVPAAGQSDPPSLVLNLGQVRAFTVALVSVLTDWRPDGD